MRKRGEFRASEIMRDEKDTNIAAYINALLKAGYLEVVRNAVRAYDRRYKLTLNSGEKAPTYRITQNPYTAWVIDKNISREFDITGVKTPVVSDELYAVRVLLNENKEVSYKELLEIFPNPDHPKGYDYNKLHYYLDLLKENQEIEEIEYHLYRTR
jgi:hypothetical protein